MRAAQKRMLDDDRFKVTAVADANVTVASTDGPKMFFDALTLPVIVTAKGEAKGKFTDNWWNVILGDRLFEHLGGGKNGPEVTTSDAGASQKVPVWSKCGPEDAWLAVNVLRRREGPEKAKVSRYYKLDPPAVLVPGMELRVSISNSKDKKMEAWRPAILYNMSLDTYVKLPTTKGKSAAPAAAAEPEINAPQPQPPAVEGGAAAAAAPAGTDGNDATDNKARQWLAINATDLVEDPTARDPRTEGLPLEFLVPFYFPSHRQLLPPVRLTPTLEEQRALFANDPAALAKLDALAKDEKSAARYEECVRRQRQIKEHYTTTLKPARSLLVPNPQLLPVPQDMTLPRPYVVLPLNRSIGKDVAHNQAVFERQPYVLLDPSITAVGEDAGAEVAPLELPAPGTMGFFA